MSAGTSVTRISRLSGGFNRHLAPSGPRHGHSQHDPAYDGKRTAKVLRDGRVLPSVHSKGRGAPLPSIRRTKGQTKEPRMDSGLPKELRGNQGSLGCSNIAVSPSTRRSIGIDDRRIQFGHRGRPRTTRSKGLGAFGLLQFKAPAKPTTLAPIRPGVVGCI